MRTYIYFISLLLSYFSFSQTIKNDTLKEKRIIRTLRVGTDLSKFVKSAIIKDYSAFEINADLRILENYYFAGEYGRENRTLDETQLNYTANGYYFKVGFDYNTYKNWLNMTNSIYVGLRYGFSSYRNTLNSYTVLNSDQYWQENTLKTSSIEYEKSTTHFAELIIGLKAEIFKNIYIGANVQLKKYFENNSPANFDNLYIPGFGITTDDSKWGVGFGYTLSYLIPLNK